MRRSDWEQRLAGYLAGKRTAAFVWGENDCALFAAGAVEAITGEDPVPEFRGKYSTAAGSVRALKRYGAGDLESTMTAKFGEPVAPAFLMRGDPVMHEGALGVCDGRFSLFVGQEGEREGLVRLPTLGCDKGWRV